MEIAKDHVVSIHYTLTDNEGTKLDSSRNGSPLVYIQGLGHIIPGLEEALQTKKKGDTFQVTIEPERAYGPKNDQMVQEVPRSEFSHIENLAVGMQFEVNTENGPLILAVKELKDEVVVVDGNHPLAGVTLNFDVEVMDIRLATKEELDHGHVHGEGGHQH